MTRKNMILLALLAALAATSLTGCVSVGVVRLRVTDPQGETGVIEVSVYDSIKQKKLESPSKGGQEIELLLLEQGRETEIGNYPGSSCRKEGLSPGTYRIRVRPSETSSGSGQPSSKVIAQKDLRVRAGETTHADVVLKKFPTTAVLISAGVVVAAVAIAAATSPVIGLGSGSFCGRHVDPDSERPEPELPPLFDLVRPMPLR